MMEKIKKNMKPTLVLGAICVVVAALMALVNFVTGPEIERRRAEEITKSLTEVMPGGEFNVEPDELRDDAPKTVKAVYTDKNGGGYVFVLETKTEYTGNDPMGITVGISKDGTVVGVKLTSYSESKDFGKTEYPDKFIGLDAGGVGSAPLVSGVTYSSSAFKSAIYDALKYIGVASGDVSAPEETEKPEVTPLRSDEEIVEAAKALSGASSAEDVTPAWSRPYNMPRLYKLNGDYGFVAYVVTLGWGNYPVSEGIVHIDINGDIKGMKVLTWVPGGGSPNYDAPEFTDAIVDSYVGKDLWHISSAELVSGATGTSTDYKNAVIEALNYVSVNLVTRSDKKVLELASELVPFASGFEAVSIDGMPETVKRLYKVNGIKSGYVAHIIVPGAYTPVATEALIYFDKDGVIGNVNLLVWNVGHGVGAGDFADWFIGKDKDTVAEVELVTAATGTSGDFKAEIEKILPLIPTASKLPVVIGAVTLVVILAGFVSALIYFKRRLRAR